MACMLLLAYLPLKNESFAMKQFVAKHIGLSCHVVPSPGTHSSISCTLLSSVISGCVSLCVSSFKKATVTSHKPATNICSSLYACIHPYVAFLSAISCTGSSIGLPKMNESESRRQTYSYARNAG